MNLVCDDSLSSGFRVVTERRVCRSFSVNFLQLIFVKCAKGCAIRERPVFLELGDLKFFYYEHLLLEVLSQLLIV